METCRILRSLGVRRLSGDTSDYALDRERTHMSTAYFATAYVGRGAKAAVLAKTYTATGAPALLILLLVVAALVGVGVAIGRRRRRR